MIARDSDAMGTARGKNERPADDRDEAAEPISETVTLQTAHRFAGSAGRTSDSEDGAGPAAHSADPTTPAEDSADRAWVASGSSEGPSSLSAPERDAPDDLEVAVKARVFETLFREPTRPNMLGRYVVLGTLGQGGMGTVFEAFDRTLDRKVAIKVLNEDLDDRFTARLLREARAMAKLSHPHVVPVFEADTVDGQTFVVMEFVQGQTLRSWMRQHPRPDWQRCVEVFIQAGQGLAAAHRSGLVHRDFKPSNAIIDDEGRARVLDFGLARRAELDITDDARLDRQGGPTDHDRSLDTPSRQSATTGTTRAQRRHNSPPIVTRALTETGAVMGTPAYMPPEQLEGREADARSDQFSFCASLYEAVYGERPFEGGTLTRLRASTMRDDIRPVPKGSPVPTPLRTILVRGLAADPAQRWPSMEALLHQLRTLVTPRARWRIAVGLTAGLGALGGGLALGQYAELKDRCTGAQAQIDGIWNEDRRGQVRTAILSTERSFAPGTWARIEPKLDAYARDWVDTHTEVCEATSVRGEQSEEALDLRMRCLGQHRAALRATVDVLADADATVVTHAIKLVADLPPATRCNDLARLERHNRLVPPPEDPEVTAAVQAQRARLADIEAMTKAGRYGEALDAARAVVEQAEALGYPPLQAEAIYWRGTLRHRNGQYTEAEQDLRQAHALAVEHHHDPIALDTAQILTGMVSYWLARHDEGRQWGEMVALPLAQRSGEPTERADSLTHLGGIFSRQGDYETARIHYQRALAIRYEALGPDHPHVASGLNNMGNVLDSQGDYEAARIHHERALAIWSRALGPDHPHVATSLHNLGNVFYRQGDLEEARIRLQRALAIEHEALGPDHPSVAMNLAYLGYVYCGQGDHDKARIHHQRALAIWDEALDPDHPHRAYSWIGLAIIALQTGDPASARAHAERAVSIREAATVEPALLAEARFVLARALWSTPSERTHARALAKQAWDALATAQGPGESEVDLDEVEAWLAAHHVD